MEEFLKRVGMTHSGVCISTIHTSAKWEEDGQLAKEESANKKELEKNEVEKK